MVLELMLGLALHAQPPLCAPQSGVRLSPNAPFTPGAAGRAVAPGKARQVNECPENAGLAAVENKPENLRVQSGGDAPARLTPIDLSRARELFQRIKNDSRYSFRNPVDGCFARSHLVAAELQRQGIASAKAWLYEGNGRRLRVEREGRRYEWEFHVANLIAVKKDGCVELMVLDPGVADGPVTVAEWRAAQTRHAPDQPTRLKISSRFDYEAEGFSAGLQSWNCTHFSAAREVNEQFLESRGGAPPPTPAAEPRGGVSRWWHLLTGAAAHAEDAGDGETYTFTGRVSRLEGSDFLVKGRAAYYRLANDGAPASARTLQRLRNAYAEGKSLRFTVRHATAQVVAVQVLP